MSFKDKIKSSAKPIVRPMWLAIWHRIAFRVNSMIAGAVDPLARRISLLEMGTPAQQDSGILSSLSALARAFSAQVKQTELSERRFADTLEGLTADLKRLEERLNQSIAGDQQWLRERLEGHIMRDQRKLEDRVEFLRREILFEMKYGERTASNASSEFDRNALGDSAEPLQARIIAPDKLGAFGKGHYQLNLGCGLHPLEEYINVDMRELPGVDVVASVDGLPFEKGDVEKIFSAHLVEHFPQEMLKRRLLPYWKSLLRPGGVFHAIMPDCEAMIKHAATGEYSFADFREVLFGAQDYAGDFHYNALTPDSFAELLKAEGFLNIDIRARGRRNGLCYEFEISASSPS